MDRLAADADHSRDVRLVRAGRSERLDPLITGKARRVPSLALLLGAPVPEA